MRLVSVVINTRSLRAMTTSSRVRRSSILVLRGYDRHDGRAVRSDGSPVRRSGRVLHLEGTRRGRDEDHLGHQLHELVEVEGSIVQRAGSRNPCSTSVSFRERSPAY